MQSTDKLTYSIAALIAGGLVVLGWRMWTFEPPIPPIAGTEYTSAAPEIDPATLALYSSGEFGISFFYPATLELAPDTPDSKIVELRGSDRVVTVRGEPLSESLRDRSCVNARPAESPLGAQTYNNRIWHGFTRMALGTENERILTEYRTANAGRCIIVSESRPSATTGKELVSQAVLPIILQGFTIADSNPGSE